MSLRGGLKLINVCNVGIAYTIAAFLPTQGAAIASPSMQMPVWSSLFMISVFILGFPIVLILHRFDDIYGTVSLNKLKIKYNKIKAERCSFIRRGVLKSGDLNQLFDILRLDRGIHVAAYFPDSAVPGPDPGQACRIMTEIIFFYNGVALWEKMKLKIKSLILKILSR